MNENKKFDVNGFNKYGLNKDTGTEYDLNGFNLYGFNVLKIYVKNCLNFSHVFPLF